MRDSFTDEEVSEIIENKLTLKIKVLEILS